jgi:hypothetical protein
LSIDPNLPLTKLSMQQWGQFCDWIASRYGGYGAVDACDDSGDVTVQLDTRDQCIGMLAGLSGPCTNTIGQVEMCTSGEATLCEFESRCLPLLC